MHCHHQRKPLTLTQEARPQMSKDKRSLLKSVRQKKTFCPSTLKLPVTVPSQKVRLKNPNLVSHPTTVTIIFNHLVFDQLPLTQNKSYYQLFSTGHSASSAHHAYETKLVLESDENIMTSLADRVINPNAQTYLDYTLNGEKNTLVLRMEMLKKLCSSTTLNTKTMVDK